MPPPLASSVPVLGELLNAKAPGVATGFPFWGESSLWILGSGVPSRPNPSSGALKSTLPGPWEGSSILNVDLVVMSAAVQVPQV